MTADQIRALRRALDEDAETFGRRFGRSGRAVENWEQGRNKPDALVLREMAKIAARLNRRQ